MEKHGLEREANILSWFIISMHGHANSLSNTQLHTQTHKPHTQTHNRTLRHTNRLLLEPMHS